jgi:hypothetical protein
MLIFVGIYDWPLVAIVEGIPIHPPPRFSHVARYRLDEGGVCLVVLVLWT